MNSKVLFLIMLFWTVIFAPVIGCYGQEAEQERLSLEAENCELMYYAPSFDYERPKLHCWFEVGSDGKVSEYSICTCNQYKYKKIPGGGIFEVEETN